MQVVILSRGEHTPFRPVFYVPFGRAGPLIKADPPATPDEPLAGTQASATKVRLCVPLFAICVC